MTGKLRTLDTLGLPLTETMCRRSINTSRKGFKTPSCTKNSLRALREFYLRHRPAFDHLYICTFDIATGQPTSRQYPKARLMDIVGWVEGFKLDAEERAVEKRAEK